LPQPAYDEVVSLLLDPAGCQIGHAQVHAVLLSASLYVTDPLEITRRLRISLPHPERLQFPMQRGALHADELRGA
jgi:hypothetical protein